MSVPSNPNGCPMGKLFRKSGNVIASPLLSTRSRDSATGKSLYALDLNLNLKMH